MSNLTNNSFTDNPQTDVNTSVPGITKFHCVFDWKLSDTSVMYFSNVQGVDSDAEIVPETDLSKIKPARIKPKWQGSDEKILARYQSPFWWSKSFLLGATEMYLANLKDKDEPDKDASIESINTIGLDTFLHKYEVLSHYNFLLEILHSNGYFSFLRNIGKNHQTNV